MDRQPRAQFVELWSATEPGAVAHHRRQGIGHRQPEISFEETDIPESDSEAYTRRFSLIDYLGYTRFSNLAIDKQIKHQLRSQKSLTNTGKKNLRNAMKRIRKEGGPLVTCVYVVDLGNGRSKLHMVGEVCPTITMTRGGGQDYYLLSIVQRLSAFDMHEA